MAKSWNIPPLQWRGWTPWEPETPSPPDTWAAICGTCLQKSACVWRTQWAPLASRRSATTRACPTETNCGPFSMMRDLWGDDTKSAVLNCEVGIGKGLGDRQFLLRKRSTRLRMSRVGNGNSRTQREVRGC